MENSYRCFLMYGRDYLRVGGTIGATRLEDSVPEPLMVGVHAVGP